MLYKQSTFKGLFSFVFGRMNRKQRRGESELIRIAENATPTF